MAQTPYSFVQPADIQSVGGFLGERFQANLNGKLKDPILAEEYIRRYERKDHPEWFWAGEQLGKWLDSAAHAALIAKDPALLKRIEEILARLEKTQETDGALSITARRNRVPARGMELYEYYYLLHGLLVLHELLGSEKALALADRLGEYIIQNWGTEPGQFPLAGRFPGNGHGGGEGTLILEPILLLGMRLGKAQYIEWGQRTLRKWDDWLQAYPESRFTCGYSAMQQFAAGEKQVFELRPGIHAHTFHMTLLGIAALYNATGSQEYRDVFLGCTDRLASEWVFITGGMSSGEGYLPRRYYHPRGEIEVCPQHTWILMLTQAYQWTGQAQYLSEIERDLFNQFLAAQLADGSNWSYMTPLNGQAQEPYSPNCCNASGQRIAARMPVYAYGLREQAPALHLYTASACRFQLPGQPDLTLSQETAFPSSGEVTVRVQSAAPATFPIHFRIPPYALEPSLRVAGEPARSATPGTFETITRAWQPNDTLSISMKLPLQCQSSPNVTALMRGPLVYAHFQAAQPNPGTYLGRNGLYPEDAVLRIDPSHPADFVREEPAGPGLLGPALRVPARIQPQAPMFAGDTGDAGRYGPQEAEVCLLPFANQGKIQGHYAVFNHYQKE